MPLVRDCTTKDVDRSEMFIVEGDSAGGSATAGSQRGDAGHPAAPGQSLLNVEKARLDKVLAFEEIRTLIARSSAASARTSTSTQPATAGSSS